MSQPDTPPLQPSPTPLTVTTTASQSASHSQPSSPRSSHGLPSPPDSPYSDSVSSFPSVSSSFFFSSAAVSPPHHSNDEGDHSSSVSGPVGPGLIIPSLTLPDAVKRPTAYGKTIGELKMIVVDGGGGGRNGGRSGGSGRERAAASSLKTERLARMLLEDNEDVVETAEQWEDIEDTALRVLRASTDWVEHRDAHGLDKFEPARNIQIYEVDDSLYEDASKLSDKLKAIIQEPFHNLSNVLGEKALTSAPDAVPMLASLISAPTSPLYTVLVILIQSSPTPLEEQLVDTLASQIPIICIPSSSFSFTSLSPRTHNPSYTSTMGSNDTLSSFRPLTPLALRHGLFRSPEILATIRTEASEKFLRWSRVEGVVKEIWNNRSTRGRNLTITQSTALSGGMARSKVGWEKEWQGRWEEQLSGDVSARLREMEREADNADLSESSDDEQRSGSSASDQEDNGLPLSNSETAENIQQDHTAKSGQDNEETSLSQTVHPLAPSDSSQPSTDPESLASSVLPGSESEPEVARRIVGVTSSTTHQVSNLNTIRHSSISAKAAKRALPLSGTVSKSISLPPNSKHRKTRSKTKPPPGSRMYGSRKASSTSPTSKASGKPSPISPSLAFDPLHLPSLLVFSLSLLGPLKAKLGSTIMTVIRRDGRAEGKPEKSRVTAALAGASVGFCVGVGVGLMISSYGVLGSSGGTTA
ncbi:hypothetical protein VNI00_012386 [Paramarasmius palmivorus]|uniref:Uncharacterized protein n=1 Tax=Paramarasmius palmivorus TaxID=297713 RepID=A0AAW0C6N6_9AGAR